MLPCLEGQGDAVKRLSTGNTRPNWDYIAPNEVRSILLRPSDPPSQV